MHRASSTSCQIAFNYLMSKTNARTLFYYPSTGISEKQSAYGHNSLVSNERIINPELFDELLVELSRVPEDIPILLSAEEFWSLCPVDLIERLKGFHINVVVFNREYYGWLFSIWSLLMSTSDIFYNPYDFILQALENVKECRDKGSISFYDKELVLKRWCETVGRNAFFQIDFPQKIPHCEILDHMLPTGYPAAWRTIDISENNSPTIDSILLRHNRSLLRDDSRIEEKIDKLQGISGIEFPFLNLKTVEFLRI